MALLIFYILLALGVSFVCSIAEAVILSVTSPHVSLLEKNKRPSGALLRELRDDINRPLAAILTLNTIAHTVGAAGAGAQAAIVFGNRWVGVASAILTLLILILSEIIPKTLGALYWKRLAPFTAYVLRWLILALLPFVKLSEWLTRGFSHGQTLKGFNRDEMAAMAALSTHEGQLSEVESGILVNLLELRRRLVREVLTPRTVVFSLAEETTVEEFVDNFRPVRFSRIPLYSGSPENITSYAMRTDILTAWSRGLGEQRLKDLGRSIETIVENTRLSQAFDDFLQRRAHIMFVVDEHGGMAGILTLEDVLEALIGREIVDELDETADMRKLARTLWERRKQSLGLDDNS